PLYIAPRLPLRDFELPGQSARGRREPKPVREQRGGRIDPPRRLRRRHTRPLPRHDVSLLPFLSFPAQELGALETDLRLELEVSYCVPAVQTTSRTREPRPRRRDLAVPSEVDGRRAAPDV